MSAIQLTALCDQPLPSSIGFSASSGGGYAAATYSWLVVARNSDAPYASTSDRDNLGLPILPCLNHAVTLSQKVVLTWTAAKDSAGNVRTPRYYDIYQLAAAGWSYTTPADLVATVDGNILTATLLNGASLGTATIAAAANSFVISPTLPLNPVVRPGSLAGFNGLAYRPSYAQKCLTRELSLTVLQGSLALADWKTLLKWATDGVPVRLKDEDNTAFIEYYYGRFIGTDYLASVWKDPRAQHTIQFLVERETRY